MKPSTAVSIRPVLYRLPRILVVPAAYSAWFVLLFGPVLFGDKLFPSDGQLAAFFAPVTPWNILPLAGVPAIGEPHLQQLYPLRWVFAALPREIGFDLFMVSSYVLASSLAFGYAFTLTRSVLAAGVGGLVFGMSGYMIAHLGHTGMVPAAAWLPLIMWSFEMLRRNVSVGWVVIGALSVAMVIVGGHPQAFAYSLYLAFAYAVFLGSTAQIGWLRYVGLCSIVICIGSALAAPHVLPMLELADLSVRSELTFEAFKEFSMPLRQLPMLLYPYLFGGAFLPDFPAYFGKWNFAEISGYMGLLPLVLAGIACWYRWNDRLVAFWLGAAALSFLLALGEATPLLWITYHLPVINKLRAPARHFHEMALAVSVLAAFGIHALYQAENARKAAARALTVGALIMLLTLAVIAVFFDELQSKALGRGANLGEAYKIHALMVPILVFVASALALMFWLRKADSRARQWLMVGVLAMDLWSFGRFAEWRWGPPKSVLSTPEFAVKYVAELTRNHQRLMPMRGWEEPVLPFSTMMSQLYGIPSVSGYGPLLIQRYANLSMVTNGGWINPRVLLQEDRAPDLLAARYIVVPRRDRSFGAASEKVQWSEKDLPLGFGSGCGGTTGPRHARLVLPAPLRIDRVGIVSKMACSTGLEQAQEVAKLTLVGADERIEARVLRAGQDTAEWAIDCDDVRPVTKHTRATVFDSWDTIRAGHPTCRGHRFVTEVPVQAGAYKELIIDWIPDAPNVIAITKISLLDSKTGLSYTVSDEDLLFSDSARFERVEDFETSSVYRNRRAMPRAWLVSEVISAKEESILQSIRTSVMPDGRAFDPRRTAFVEAPFSLAPSVQDGAHSIEIVDLSADRVEITTQAERATFMVLSDVHYPGWTASIDGESIEILRTNYALRGVAVPAGRHTIVLRYRPSILYLGLLISALTSLGLVGFAVFAQRNRGHQQKVASR